MGRGIQPTRLAARTKLSVEQKQQIAARRQAGERAIDLAAEYGVNSAYVGRVASLYAASATNTESFAWLNTRSIYQGGEA